MERKILLVDDEKQILDGWGLAFRNAGYTVHCAENAEEAQEILNQENSQVVFLDLKLPGMNGVELCERIRRDWPLVVIYAVTGYPSLFELVDCREAGFDDYFAKPVDLEVLLKAAEDAFERIDRWKTG